MIWCKKVGDFEREGIDAETGGQCRKLILDLFFQHYSVLFSTKCSKNYHGNTIRIFIFKESLAQKMIS